MEHKLFTLEGRDTSPMKSGRSFMVRSKLKTEKRVKRKLQLILYSGTGFTDLGNAQTVFFTSTGAAT